MTEFKVGDKIVIGKNGIAAPVGTSFLVVEKLKVPGVWIDCTAKEVDVKYVSKGYINSYADFKLAEEEKVKHRFAVGDRVISIKNTPQAPEGFIGHISLILGGTYGIHVTKEGEYGAKAFDENELELLSVGKRETKFNPTLSEIENYNFPDTIAPQDIAGVSKSALDKQIGGGHYKEKGIQPIEYIFANNLGFCEANIVKYATRWKDKNGIQDLEKIIHYTELLIELTKKEESKDKEGK